MSELMIDDTLRMNNINPFWDEPPGAWSKPYKYTPTVQNVIEREPQELGVNNRGVEYACDLKRSLYPKRNIDGGLWTLSEPDVKPRDPVVTPMNNIFMMALAIILLVFILNNMR